MEQQMFCSGVKHPKASSAKRSPEDGGRGTELFLVSKKITDQRVWDVHCLR